MVVATPSISGSSDDAVSVNNDRAHGVLSGSLGPARLPYRLRHELFFRFKHRDSFSRNIWKIQ